jgi:hypothetical protein
MLERSYLLPLWDRSWSNDTLVRFEYMDEPPSGKEIDAQLMRGGAPLSVVTGTTTRKQLLAQATPQRRVALPNGFESWQYALKRPRRRSATRWRRPTLSCGSILMASCARRACASRGRDPSCGAGEAP